MCMYRRVGGQAKSSTGRYIERQRWVIIHWGVSEDAEMYICMYVQESGREARCTLEIYYCL